MKLLSSFTRQSIVVFVCAIVLATAGSIAAWTGPGTGVTPPDNNAAAPINVGSTDQTKNGGIWAASVGSDGGYCIGTDCITSWSEAVGGFGQWTTTGSDIYYNAGNVGIGTSGALSKLYIQSGSTAHTGSEGVAHGLTVTTGTNQQSIWMGYDGVSDIGYINAAKNGAIRPVVLQSRGGNVGIGTADPISSLDVTGNIKVGAGSYSGNYGMINFPSSDNDNGFLWACTSSNGCATNTWDLRLYLQDDQDDSQKFSIWGGSCQNGGCSLGGDNVAEQFHATAAGNVWARGNMYAAGYFHNSDARLKDNIRAFPNALEIVTKLHGVTFNWKKDGTPSAGVVAQEVAQVMPSAVKIDATTGMQSVEYDQLIAPLIEAIKAQQEQIDAQRAQIASLEHDITQLKKTH